MHPFMANRRSTCHHAEEKRRAFAVRDVLQYVGKNGLSEEGRTDRFWNAADCPLSATRVRKVDDNSLALQTVR